EELLDWVSAASEAGIPESKARMIRLEARQAALAQVEPTVGETKTPVKIIPLLILDLDIDKRVVLAENRDLAAIMEKDLQLTPLLKKQTPFDYQGYRMIPRSTTMYDPTRPLYEY